jgi:protein tyrosine/serine phosphatase
MSAGVPNWVELEGGANARDVGGLPTSDGRSTRAGALIRSANLQHLTEADLAHLVTKLGVRCVVDLRTDVEVEAEGPGPMTRQAGVVVHHLSLFPDAGRTADRVEHPGESIDNQSLDNQSLDDPGFNDPSAGDPSAGDPSTDERGGMLLPWHHRDRPPPVTGVPVADLYLTYLDQRPDSVVAALRAIAESDGAALVHCAAGKDRTGVVIAIALSMVGVDRKCIVNDYAATEQQIGAIVGLLRRTQTYQREVADPAAIPAPEAGVMTAVLDALSAGSGGIEGWLAGHGWTSADTDRLRKKLLR